MHSRRQLRSMLLVAVLAAPAASCARPRASAGIGVTVAPRTGQVVLKPGETLWRVARRYGLSADELARRNGIDDPARVRAGTVLTVPEATGGDKSGRASGGPKSLATTSSAAATPTAATTAAPTTATPTTGAMPGAPASAGKLGTAAPEDHDGAGVGTTAAPPGDSGSRLHGEPAPAPSPAGPGGTGERSGGSDAPPGTYPLRWPVDGKVVARFGPRDGAPHDGIDIAVPAGTEVHAAAAGRVIYSGRYGGYGNLVILRHDSGLLTVYARNAVNLVRRGQHVAAGQVVGKVASPTHGGAPQLHFEVREGIEAKNPVKFLPP